MRQRTGHCWAWLCEDAGCKRTGLGDTREHVEPTAMKHVQFHRKARGLK